MNFTKLSADNLDEVTKQEEMGRKDFLVPWQHTGALSHRINMPLISDIFTNNVLKKVTSKMKPLLPYYSQELCRVTIALIDCRLPSRSSTQLLPTAFRAVPVI